ncbi:Mg(2+) chelatase family protein [Cutibacterium acnes JCM 18920]|nr:Mg(2+) chelatase family protein [Cutibacterium acnes JCM 18920]
MTRPPLAQPHHSVSMAAMVGGGARIAQPGAISLAHRGVLFLDEAPEFAPKVLDSLRGPLETGEIVIGRSQAHTTFPLGFSLLWRSIRARVGWPMTHRDGARALRNRSAGIQVGFRARS